MSTILQPKRSVNTYINKLQQEETDFDPHKHPVIIVGSGPIGQFAAQQLSSSGQKIVLLNGEKWQPYNRIKLAGYLAASTENDTEEAPFLLEGHSENVVRHDCRVAKILPSERAVALESGELLTYSRLMLCLGARADLPPIPGAGLKGVFTFRNKNDVRLLAQRARVSKRAVVLGGGLLGLEAARGLAARGIETVVIERGPYLMARQLDSAAGGMLGRSFETFGIRVITDSGVSRIKGEHWVESVELANGETLDCDTLVICAGIRANAELAAEAGLAVGRGIIVDAAMRTSDPHIFAAGDCTEFEGVPTGLVAPGLEQARIMVGASSAAYRPVLVPTKLKVAGLDVFSIGDIAALETMTGVRKRIWRDESAGLYRVVYEKDRQALGALSIGPWPDQSRLQQFLRDSRRLRPWEIYRFTRTGLLWPAQEGGNVQALPAAAVICNCTGVTKGTIEISMRAGCKTYEDIQQQTGASTVCGSCKPAILELLGGEAVRSPVDAYKTLALASLASCGIGVVLGLAPAIPFATKVTDIGLLERLWTVNILRQITGFTLLAFIVILVMLSARKRLPRFQWGSYKVWRLVHAAMGAMTLAFLYIHTGGRWGHGLSHGLMTAFVSVAVIGGVVGLGIAFEHRIGTTAHQAARLRRALFWFHLLVSWPLPVLLLAHIFVGYVF